MIPSNKQQQLINCAIHEAQQSKMVMRHGAIAVMNGRIIAKNSNHYHPLKNGASCHAECAVLHKLLKQNITKRSKIIIYIVRINPKNEIRESAPCIDCYEKMLFYGIKTIIFIEAK